MDLYEIRIESLGASGVAIGRLANGKVILVPKALKGENVLVSLEKEKANLAWANLEQILEASEDRVKEDCVCAKTCGGCDFLHVNKEIALKLKTEANLNDLLEQFKPDYVESANYQNYRTRVTLHLDVLSETGELAVGFYDKNRNLVVFETCNLMAKEFLPVINIIKKWLKNLDVSFKNLELNFLQGVDKNILLCFSPNLKIKKLLPNVYDNLNKNLEILNNLFIENKITIGLASKVSLKSDPKIISEPNAVLYCAWPNLNLELKAFHGAFTQVNLDINKKMVNKILEEAEVLKKEKKLKALDLYSGLGNIAFPLLNSGFYVTAVEENSQAVKAAKMYAKGNKKFKQIMGLSEIEIKKLIQKKEKFDLIVLDPPRAGAKDLAFDLAKLGATIIIYISCHPAAFKRDLPGILSLGYSLKKLTVYDMFPRTSHIEILSIFTLS